MALVMTSWLPAKSPIMAPVDGGTTLALAASSTMAVGGNFITWSLATRW